MDRDKQHGGKRKNAGRPKGRSVETISICVDEWTKDVIDAVDKNRSKAVREIADHYVKTGGLD